jgi:phosphatidylserine decarboxylase precursor-related protein
VARIDPTTGSRRRIVLRRPDCAALSAAGEVDLAPTLVTLFTWTAFVCTTALVVLFGWWRFHFFHRNPPRAIAPGNDPLCPADGRILYAEEIELSRGTGSGYHRRVQEAFAAEGRWTVIATYLGILDVHFVRAPIAGTVRIRHMEPLAANQSMGLSFVFAAVRRPLPIGKRGYLDKNEFLGVEIVGDARFLVVLMADWWIDQIIMLVHEGQHVERGQLIGKIQMGSQVDVWGPAGHFVPVRTVGERVRAGERLATIRAAISDMW